ncbi:MAG: cytochrome c biogenesis protein CcsA, partial [Gemmatimonadetes bacterium]|nr:cytochrome c biogenesis protein CcsA [Gemmatimonadota bacterium]
MTILGQIALGLGLLLATWGAVVGTIGGIRGRPELIDSARRAVFALFAVIGVAALSLLVALLTRDFNVEYVWSYTSRQLPTVYTISAFWAGQAGSLLFWTLILTGFAAAAMWLTSSRYERLMPYVGAVTCAVALFFIAAMLFSANPFDRLPFTPADGNGLNPQLQNPGMAIHPPMLYAGYVLFTIPFAFAIGALASRRVDASWIRSTRRFTLVAWVFLTIGLALGARWSYSELGWGGYWAWDPVENAALLPWLTGTAFLHSIMVQERRGMLRVWN